MLHFGELIKGNFFANIKSMISGRGNTFFLMKTGLYIAKTLIIYTFCIHNALYVCVIHVGFENTICDW